MEKFMLPCLQKKLFGTECMGCGFQRSIALFCKGEFVEAFYMYPALYPLLGLLSIIGYSTFFELKYSAILINILAVTTVLTVVLNYVLKFI